jgi:hypothetical protein
MTRTIWLTLAMLLITGCKDKPYKERKNREQIPYGFSGVVELGAPVSGATIAAHSFSGLIKGEKIAETVSNRDGSFEFRFKTDYEGPLLLTANGGLYRDLASGNTIALNHPRTKVRGF